MKKGRARSCDPCSRPSARTRNDLFGELDLLRHRLFHTAPYAKTAVCFARGGMFLPLWGMFLTVGLTSLDSDLGLFVKMTIMRNYGRPLSRLQRTEPTANTMALPNAAAAV